MTLGCQRRQSVPRRPAFVPTGKVRDRKDHGQRSVAVPHNREGTSGVLARLDSGERELGSPGAGPPQWVWSVLPNHRGAWLQGCGHA